MTSDVAVTIVVPTHNRVTALMRLLRALERQTPIDGGFEVVVVDDGSTDGTGAAVAAVDWNFPLIVHKQVSSGPAAARNAGVARGAGELLLFLDDDVEPMSDVVGSHAMFHRGCENCVAIGDLQPVVAAAGYLGTLLRGLWQAMYEGPRQPGHRAQYRDLISAHFSMPRASFEALQGFNSCRMPSRFITKPRRSRSCSNGGSMTAPLTFVWSSGIRRSSQTCRLAVRASEGS